MQFFFCRLDQGVATNSDIDFSHGIENYAFNSSFEQHPVMFRKSLILNTESEILEDTCTNSQNRLSANLVFRFPLNTTPNPASA